MQIRSHASRLTHGRGSHSVRSSRLGLALFLGACFFLGHTSSSRAADGPRSIGEWLRTVERAKERYREDWSVLVKDLQTGATILSHNAGQPLIPASNRKIVVFALAIEKLGPEYRFRTELGLTVDVLGAGGVLGGTVVLRSNGDPTMRNRFLSQKNPNSVLRGWIAGLVSMGIKRVNGDFVIDASAFGWEQDQYPEAWDASHRNHAYAMLPSALALNENLLRVSVKPSSQVGAPGRVLLYPTNEGIGIINQTKTASGSQQGLDAKFTPDGRNLIVAGRIGRRIRTHVVNVPLARPIDYISGIAGDALRAEGIELAGEVRVVFDPNEGRRYRIVRTVGKNESVPLIELLRIMMRDSDNFLAEQLWRATAYRVLGLGDSASARRLEQAWYDSHGLRGIVPGYDGSGLSRKNRVSASALVSILLTIHASPFRAYLFDSLPASGRSGTLRHRTMGARAGRVVAKTGSLSGAASLSGFILDTSRRPRWVFSLIANAPRNTNGRLTTRQNQIMKILIQLLDSGRMPSRSSKSNPPLKRPRQGVKVYVGRTS